MLQQQLWFCKDFLGDQFLGELVKKIIASCLEDITAVRSEAEIGVLSLFDSPFPGLSH